MELARGVRKPPADSPLQPRLGTTADRARPAVDCAGPGAALRLGEFRPGVAESRVSSDLIAHAALGHRQEPGGDTNTLCQVTGGS